jgi:hypothetical protein
MAKGLLLSAAKFRSDVVGNDAGFAYRVLRGRRVKSACARIRHDGTVPESPYARKSFDFKVLIHCDGSVACQHRSENTSLHRSKNASI